MDGELAFFELGVDDTEVGRPFYEGLFGWKLEPGPNAGGFEITTPSVPGGMHGGDPGAAPYLFFRVDDMDAALQRVRELGGVVDDADVEGDEESIARYGRFKLCRDNQGSPFGLHTPPAGASGQD
ncbi:MAG TPA: VOC family protein [Euzebyales bacterium]|nr:VOC family protein [Euzebyales bacterium]